MDKKRVIDAIQKLNKLNGYMEVAQAEAKRCRHHSTARFLGEAMEVIEVQASVLMGELVDE